MDSTRWMVDGVVAAKVAAKTDLLVLRRYVM